MSTEVMQQQICSELQNNISYQGELSEEELKQQIVQAIHRHSHQNYIRLGVQKAWVQTIYNSIRKLDAIQELLEDEEITEIMVNGPDDIFIEKNGKLMQSNRKFTSMDKLIHVVNQMASKGNRIVNESSPILDVRFEDGSRINVVLPPVAINGPIITIRKFPKEALTMEGLIAMGAISREAAAFLQILVEAKYNIFISGGTGAGKTTFLNILSNFIPSTERIITIEDSAELQIQNVPNLVRLEARTANVEGKNAVTIRDLIKSALRMRPDRVIVGEIRDATAIDMLTAFNTGHDGSLSTGHANSPQDMMSRLETLVLMGMEIPLGAIRNQISSAIDIVVHLGRLRDKSRKVLSIMEVGKVVDGKVELIPLFQFEEEGERAGKVIGELRRSTNKLMNTDKCLRAGVMVDEL